MCLTWLLSALEKRKENLFCCIERVHRRINPVKNTSLPNLLLGVGARVVFSLVIKGMLSCMDPREIKAAKYLISHKFNTFTVELVSLNAAIAAASSPPFLPHASFISRIAVIMLALIKFMAKLLLASVDQGFLAWSSSSVSFFLQM